MTRREKVMQGIKFDSELFTELQINILKDSIGRHFEGHVCADAFFNIDCVNYENCNDCWSAETTIEELETFYALSEDK